MIFKIRSNKENPYKGLAYILRKDKVFVLDGVRAVDTYYLNGMNGMENPGAADFARQFRKTKEHWGKGNRENELQFFHIKISPSPKDFVCSDALLGCAREICDTLFPEFESVISVHNDTKTMHAHIIVNSVNCVTGRHLHYAKYMSTIDRMNDRAQHIGLKYGFSLTDKTPARERKSAAQQGMEKRGINTDKERLKKILLKAAAESSSEKEFVRKVQAEGVEMPKCDLGYKDFKYFMPGWKRNTRGASMGTDYSKTALEEIYIGNAWAAYQKTVPEGEKFISKRDYIEIVRYGLDPVALGVDAAREFHDVFVLGIYPGSADSDLEEVTAEKETKPAPAVTHVQPKETPEVVSRPDQKPTPLPDVKPVPSTIPTPAAKPVQKPSPENVPIAAHMREEEIPRVVAKPMNLPDTEYQTFPCRYMIAHRRLSDNYVIFEHKKEVLSKYSEAGFAVYRPSDDRPRPWQAAKYTAEEWADVEHFVKTYRNWLAKRAIREKQTEQQPQQRSQPTQQHPQPVKKKDDGFYK